MEYVLFITNKCNLDCHYCYFLNDLSRVQYPPKPIYKLHELRSFIYNTQRIYNDSIVDIFFFGDEPSLEYGYISNVISTMNKIDNIFNINYILHTNGLLLDKLPEFILLNLRLIVISINHEKMLKNDPETEYYLRILNGISLIRKKNNIPILARLTITETIDLFFIIKKLSTNFNYIHWQIENCIQFKSYENFYNNYIYSIESVFNYWFQQLRNGILINIVPFLAVIRFWNDKNNMIEFPCGFNKGSINIQTNGDCFSCAEEINNPKFMIGNIYNGIKFANSISGYSMCYECLYNNICMGRCGKMHIEYPVDHIIEYCNLNKAMFNYFIANKQEIEEIIHIYPNMDYEVRNPLLARTELIP